jgi:hypothetical protein
MTYLPRGPGKRDRQNTVFYARKHNTGFKRPPLKQPQRVYDPDLGELTDEDKQFWSAVVFVHQETSAEWYGIQGEPGWNEALELVLSGYGRKRERTLGSGIIEGWYSTWQEELTTDRARNQVVPHFLNELGLLTPTGRLWNQESWKKFRQRYGQKLQSFFNWICELRDNQERTLPTPRTNASVIYKDMKSVEGVLEAEKNQELQRLVAYANGYEGSQRKGRPRKQIAKNPAGVSGPGGPSTCSIDNDKISKQLVAGMAVMNLKPNKELLDLLEGGVG